jgi:glycosyltransferase involved in cell wall biosynthesis
MNKQGNKDELGAGDEPASVSVTAERVAQNPAHGAATGKVTDVLAALVSAQEELTRLVAASTTVLAARKAVAGAQALASAYPDDPVVRFKLLELKETAGDFHGLYEQWSELLASNPGDLRIVRYCSGHLVRERRIDEALALIDRSIPEALDDWRSGMTRAEMLADIRAHDQSDALFARLIEIHDRRELRIAFCKRLTKRGLLSEAFDVISPLVNTLAQDTKAGQLAAAVADDHAFYSRLEPDAGFQGQDIRMVALKHAILSFRNRMLPQRQADDPLSIALVTGSLGPGGAERQLTRLACHLRRLSLADTPRADAADAPRTGNIGAVEVLVKQYTKTAESETQRSADFFLGTLQDGGVPVTEINALPAVSVAHQDIESPKLRRLLEKLPAPVHYGVTRLTPLLRERRFDVVSLWQDGTCLIGALAALLAGVPVIHLVFRGLPPNIRTDRDRPEYAVLYRALAEIPGVHFVTNSISGAEEYARWLGLPLERIQILYNGVTELSADGTTEERQKWETFASSTADATETIGGVFRLEADKRPLLWIKMAARYLKDRPGARFVLVGDGRLQDKATALVAELGLKDRLLFAGLSTQVGFWYSKMDAKVLLSRFEGLPNVLIEAQLLGTAVLSTPAGGAGECFVDGMTGHLLESADHPNLVVACERLAALVDEFQADPARSERARQRARLLFSVNAMVGRFIELCVLADSTGEDKAGNDVLEAECAEPAQPGTQTVKTESA